MTLPRVLVFSSVRGIQQQIRQYLPHDLKDLTVESIAAEEADGSIPLSEHSAAVLQDAEILVTEPSVVAQHSLIYNLPKLRWMQSTWAGVDGLLKSLHPDKALPSYTLSRHGGYFGEHMAEFVVGQIIAHERGFRQLRKYQDKREWPARGCPESEYRLLSQLSIGILGLGSIGKDVARACKTFGMMVHGLVRRKVTEETKCPYVDQYRYHEELSNLLADCDYICNVLPSTATTKGLLNGSVLQATTKKPVFINLGRGDIITEASLVMALQNGWLSHAVLDVFETEPLPVSSALWEHEQVTITPHLSAITFSHQAAELFCRNLAKYIKGEEVEYIVDWSAGY